MARLVSDDPKSKNWLRAPSQLRVICLPQIVETADWPAAGSTDTEFGVLMEAEAGYALNWLDREA
jgi:hypothetical protein